MKLTTEQRAGLKAVAEFEPTGDNFSDRVNQQVTNEADLKAVARQTILDLLADLEAEELMSHTLRHQLMSRDAELAATRKQLAAAQAMVAAAIAAEREWCANEADCWIGFDGKPAELACDEIAAAIRGHVTDDAFADYALQSAIAEAVEPYHTALDYVLDVIDMSALRHARPEIAEAIDAALAAKEKRNG